MKDYVSYVYNETDRPKTAYPGELVKYLIQRCNIRESSKVLDLGCGRGDFADAFRKSGMKVSGVDISDNVTKHYPQIGFASCDFTKDHLPYKDGEFDVVFSKSVIEHLYYPDKLFLEAKRVLCRGGVLITMCPSWEHNYRTYFDDFTHRTPFMKSSLYDFNVLIGMKNVQTDYFKQLPFCWGNRPAYFFTELLRVLPINWLKKRSKLVKFAKEVMLLSISWKDD